MIRRLGLAFALLLLLASFLLAAAELLFAFDDRAQLARRPATNLTVVVFGQVFPRRPLAVFVPHVSSLRLSQGAGYANLEAKRHAKGRVSL